MLLFRQQITIINCRISTDLELRLHSPPLFLTFHHFVSSPCNCCPSHSLITFLLLCHHLHPSPPPHFPPPCSGSIIRTCIQRLWMRWQTEKFQMCACDLSNFDWVFNTAETGNKGRVRCVCVCVWIEQHLIFAYLYWVNGVRSGISNESASGWLSFWYTTLHGSSVPSLFTTC